jgi:hypothetical protein
LRLFAALPVVVRRRQIVHERVTDALVLDDLEVFVPRLGQVLSQSRRRGRVGEPGEVIQRAEVRLDRFRDGLRLRVVPYERTSGWS